MNSKISYECGKIAAHYGEKPQLGMMIEECAELIQAIRKIERGNYSNEKDVRAHYIEELADVTIMAEQLYLLLSEDEKKTMEDSMKFKLRRQIKRIASEETPLLADDLEAIMFERGEYDYGESDRPRWLDSVPNAYDLAKDPPLLQNNRKLVTIRIENGLQSKDEREALMEYLNDQIYTIDKDDELVPKIASALSRIKDLHLIKEEKK